MIDYRLFSRAKIQYLKIVDIECKKINKLENSNVFSIVKISTKKKKKTNLTSLNRAGKLTGCRKPIKNTKVEMHSFTSK